MSESNNGSSTTDFNALKASELQLIESFLQNNLVVPIVAAARIVREIVNNQLEELRFHREFEQHLRLSDVTPELLQHHLDALVALRGRLRTEMENRVQQVRQQSTSSQQVNETQTQGTQSHV